METFSALLAICAGNSPFPGEFPAQRPVTRMFILICARINGWVNNRETGDFIRQRAHHNVTVMINQHPSNTWVDTCFTNSCSIPWQITHMFMVSPRWELPRYHVTFHTDKIVVTLILPHPPLPFECRIAWAAILINMSKCIKWIH